MLATTYMPNLNFISMILVEPGICRTPQPGDSIMDMSSIVLKRKDLWANREEASNYFLTSRRFHQWDPRVVETAVVSCSVNVLL
jgi:hypothetical protein